jgi:hypothetical protein
MYPKDQHNEHNSSKLVIKTSLQVRFLLAPVAAVVVMEEVVSFQLLGRNSQSIEQDHGELTHPLIKSKNKTNLQKNIFPIDRYISINRTKKTDKYIFFFNKKNKQNR